MRILAFLQAGHKAPMQSCYHSVVKVLVEFIWADVHPKCVFSPQWYARYPVDESRSSEADGGTESVHITGRF